MCLGKVCYQHLSTLSHYKCEQTCPLTLCCLQIAFSCCTLVNSRMSHKSHMSWVQAFWLRLLQYGCIYFCVCIQPFFSFVLITQSQHTELYHKKKWEALSFFRFFSTSSLPIKLSHLMYCALPFLRIGTAISFSPFCTIFSWWNDDQSRGCFALRSPAPPALQDNISGPSCRLSMNNFTFGLLAANIAAASDYLPWDLIYMIRRTCKVMPQQPNM